SPLRFAIAPGVREPPRLSVESRPDYPYSGGLRWRSGWRDEGGSMDGVAPGPADRPALPARLRMARGRRPACEPARRRRGRPAHLELGSPVHARDRVCARRDAVVARGGGTLPVAG